MAFKKAREKYRKARVERKAYRQILAEKTTLAARQAYAKEAIKVAAERARAKARQPSGWSTFGQMVAKGVERASRTRKRTPIRRITRKRTPIRRIRRTVRRTRRLSQPRIPQTLNEAIYGKK